ncbi:hypothetical protein [Gaoshiqia sp. Z1-71]|uniref:hypothetical protein n=1 Tax=Gaoshiqia hydrogeniformans TaxID=3290090 RepID=UPI003BF7D267
MQTKSFNRWNMCAICVVFIMLAGSSCQPRKAEQGIDRYALVSRHNPLIEEFDPLASLSVGNGNFAFTTDFTGLQTFYKEYEAGVSLGTMSNWGWHTSPNTGGFDISESFQYHDVNGRKIPYQSQLRSSQRAVAAVNYFRENPHRLHLGLIRLVIRKADGNEITIDDVQLPKHRLNLWNGELASDFEVEGTPVKVRVFAHQEKDLISVQIESPFIQSNQLAVEWLFPYGAAVHTHAGYDLDSPEKHVSSLEEDGPNAALIRRQLDDDHYMTKISWNGKAKLENPRQHQFVLEPASSESRFEFSCLFSPEPVMDELPGFESTRSQNETYWAGFWSTGGAVDFSGCTDPRANELERRTVLSQYLTKINGSGNLPPQETGLTFNSWYGKFHLEMIWWHSAHFYNWQRQGQMAGQLKYYKNIYPQSLEFTRLQGYKGVRWPKMVGPDGINSPSSVGSYLIWQQPHLIYLAEQLYRSDPASGVMEEFADLIFATADFMADFATFDEETNTYRLAPPLIPAQEHWNKETTVDPPFELAYWYWGLTVAQQWKERLGQNPDPKWEEVRSKLAAPLAIDGLYMGVGNAPDSYTDPKNMRDHPMVLGALGMLPDWEKLDQETMRNTLKLIMERWDWPHTWGWDYPMVAMCATRLHEPELALEALLKDVQKNTYLKNGHNYQDDRLRIYLPGNGGFLKAIALMCAGWEGCTTENPGFPKDGNWKVKWENLNPDF